jgi:hypothetical protein
VYSEGSIVGTGQVGSTTPLGTVVLRSVITPGAGGTKVVEVVLVVVLVVVVGTVVAVGSPGTVTGGDVVSVGGAVTGVKQSVPGKYKRIELRGLAGGVEKNVAG